MKYVLGVSMFTIPSLVLETWWQLTGGFYTNASIALAALMLNMLAVVYANSR